MKRRWFAPLLLIALASLFVWFWESPPETLIGPPPSIGEDGKIPQSILIGSTTREFDDEGKLTSVFYAKESRYFQHKPNRRSEKDYARFSEPEMTFYNENEAPWTAIANTADSHNNGKRVILKGDVLLQQQDSAGDMRELSTEELVLKPEEQYAETDKAVIISGAGSETRATGMNAHLKEGKFRLLSNVRSTYDPSQHDPLQEQNP